MLPAPDKRWGAWETAGKGSLSLRHFMKRTVQEKSVITLLDDLVEVFLVHIWHLYSGTSLREYAIQIPRSKPISTPEQDYGGMASVNGSAPFYYS
jgi:hypothetical protein